MAQRDNILSFSTAGRRQPLSNKTARAIAECQRLVERTLPKLMDSLFEKLDDALYELADKSESNQLQTSYFDALRAVRRKRAVIHREFCGGVLGDFKRLWTETPRKRAPEQPRPDGDDSALSLVDNDELEQSLAVSNLVSKGENRYQRELYYLNSRLGMIAADENLDSDNNPLAPAGICHRFHQTIGCLAVDTPVLLVIYKLFDKQVMNHVGGLYEEINSILGRAGLEPKTRAAQNPPIQPPSQPEATASESYPDASVQDADSAMAPGHPPPSYPSSSGIAPPAPGYGWPPAGQTPPGGYHNPQTGQSTQVPAGAPGYPHPGPPPGNWPVNFQGGAPEQGPMGGYAGTPAYAPSTAGDYQDGVGYFHALQELIADYRARVGGPLPAQPQGLPVVATPELISALSALQLAHRGTGVSTNPFSLRSSIIDSLALERDGRENRALGKADNDAIDVIALLFEFLLEDPNLPEAMKELIARLQIPLLKIAIIDKQFFSRSLHPARRLLNSLARAALGWSDDGDRSENSLHTRIDAVVDHVVAGFEDDPSLFDQLNKEFIAQLEREQRGAEIVEERTNQVTRGKEQLRVAKQLVAREISQRLAKYQRIPLVARTLLEDAWKDVLLLAYLRQGPDSAAWEEGLEVADRLLWSVEPRVGYADRQSLLKVIPDLLRNLREGLNGISFDQHKMARLFKELQSCHIACLRGAEGSIGVAVVSDPLAGTTDKPAAAGGMGDRSHEVKSSFTNAPLDPAEKDEEDAIGRDDYSDLAENLVVGTWLEILEEDGQRVRVKLSWKSNVSDACVFVNRKGVKMLELTRAGVARLFRTGAARALEQVETPIMDRALDAMLQTLKGTKAAAG